jgi:hypothetical protein
MAISGSSRRAYLFFFLLLGISDNVLTQDCVCGTYSAVGTLPCTVCPVNTYCVDTKVRASAKHIAFSDAHMCLYSKILFLYQGPVLKMPSCGSPHSLHWSGHSLPKFGQEATYSGLPIDLCALHSQCVFADSEPSAPFRELGQHLDHQHDDTQHSSHCVQHASPGPRG